MKKVLSFSGMGIIAMSLLLNSCVSKRKYDEAQTTIQQYRADSASWAAKYNTMQQTYSTMEQSNKTLQGQYETTKNQYMTEQKRWQMYQGYYDQQRTGTQQLHQQLHSALDNVVAESNIYTAGSKVYVNLPENALFTAGSSKLTVKGRETLSKLASSLKSNPDMEVEVRANMGNNMSGSADNMRDNNAMSSDKANKMDHGDMSHDQQANVGDSGYVGSGSVTRNTNKNKSKQGNKSSNTNRNEDQKTPVTGDDNAPTSGSVTGTTQDENTRAAKKARMEKSRTTGSARMEHKDKDMNFRMNQGMAMNSSKSRSENWDLHRARLNAIASELTNDGVSTVHMVAPSGNRMASYNAESNDMSSMNKTSTASTGNANMRGYQVIISSNSDKWYDMMNDGSKSGASVKEKSGSGNGSEK